jgi:glycosyltransferase involved in cell wall biosynthesis
MKLSILICTLPQRAEMFNFIFEKLSKQINSSNKNQVEIVSDDNIHITTGEKRNQLISKAKGEFVVFVDDDDDVYDYYISEILSTIENNPYIDCIGTNGIISFNGQNQRNWYISIDYKHWHEKADGYYRTPNHISPIRKSIAEQITFPNTHHGEDFAFSMAIYPLLKNEAKIEKPMYHYKYKGKSEQIPQGEQGSPYRPAWR